MFSNSALMIEEPKLRKFAYKLTKSASDAEDLLQSTLLRALEKKDLFQDGTNLFSWSSKMMFNLFASKYRRKKKFETQYDPDDFIRKESVEGKQEIKIELMEVEEAITKLSTDHRDVLLMVCVEGMSYEDVSQQLDIPVGTVRSRLSRARSSLEEIMEQKPFKLKRVA